MKSCARNTPSFEAIFIISQKAREHLQKASVSTKSRLDSSLELVRTVRASILGRRGEGTRKGARPKQLDIGSREGEREEGRKEARSVKKCLKERGRTAKASLHFARSLAHSDRREISGKEETRRERPEKAE